MAEVCYTLNEVLEAAAQAGFPLSRHQLKRLRLNGLMASPRQQHPIGVSGSDSVYSQQDLDQLLSVLRLKHEHGHKTFPALRVAAWLDGLNVEFSQLRPDVVDLLRRSIRRQRGLSQESEDDDLSRRLREDLTQMPKRDLTVMDQLLKDAAVAADEKITFEAIALAMLQLIVRTLHAEASSDRFDAALPIEDDEGARLSDLYLQWDLPPTPHWPRIISRTGAKWFEPGRQWLALVTVVVQEGHIRAGSPLALWIINELKLRLSNPSQIELRNLIACQGVVLSKHNPNQLLEVFDSSDP